MRNNMQIKNNGADSCRADLNEIVKAKSFAESIVQLARKKADAILEKAASDGEKIKAEAHSLGFARGIEEGRKQGVLEGHMEIKTELEQTRTRMKTLEKKFNDQVLSLLDSLAQKIKDLVIALVQNIIKREIHDDGDLVIRTVKGAAKSMIQRDKVQLSVYFADVDTAIRKRDELIASSDMIKELEISAGDDVDKGGAVITSSSGIIDARIKSQLEVAGEIVNN